MILKRNKTIFYHTSLFFTVLQRKTLISLKKTLLIILITFERMILADQPNNFKLPIKIVLIVTKNKNTTDSLVLKTHSYHQRQCRSSTGTTLKALSSVSIRIFFYYFVMLNVTATLQCLRFHRV